MNNHIELTHYQITYVAKSDCHYNEESPIYTINEIDVLSQFIKNHGVNHIYSINFTFKINTYFSAGFVYYPINNQDGKYSFAPCYNYRTFDSILDKCKSDLINNLINTVQQYSVDIKEVFVDRIDHSKEIIHVFNEDY